MDKLILYFLHFFLYFLLFVFKFPCGSKWKRCFLVPVRWTWIVLTCATAQLRHVCWMHVKQCLQTNSWRGCSLFLRDTWGWSEEQKTRVKFLKWTCRRHRLVSCFLEFTFLVILLNRPSKGCPTQAQENASEMLCYQWVPAIPNPSHHFSHEQSRWLQLDFSQALVQDWHLSVPIKAHPLAPSFATQHFFPQSCLKQVSPSPPRSPSPRVKCSPE